MSKIRMYVEPVSDPKTPKEKFYWNLKENRFDNHWYYIDDWERPLSGMWTGEFNVFSGYTETKEEGIRLVKEAAKEYCRQRREKEEKQEYIRKETYMEEFSCQDLK